MRFHDSEEERVLPISKPAMLKSIYDQLKNGTIFACNPLGSYNKSEGIRFLTRRERGYSANQSNNPSYKVSNDERRKLMRSLRDNGIGEN